MVEPRRLVGQLARGCHHELGISTDRAREVRHPVHLVTGTKPRDPGPGLLHDPRDVPAEHERRVPEQRPRAGPDGGIDRVDTDRADADEHLGRQRLWPLHLGNAEDFGTSEGLLTDGSHVVSLARCVDSQVGSREGRRGVRSGQEQHAES